MNDPNSTLNDQPPTPLRLHTATVQPQWIDYNGHMNDGYYVVAFTVATDALQDYVGLDQSWRSASGCSIYSVEAHIKYLHEVKEGAPLRFDTWVLGVDEKRLHIMHAMYNADDDTLAATHELMLLHVDQKAGKVAPMPDSARLRLAALVEAHRSVPLPVAASAAIRPVPGSPSASG